MPHLSGHPVLTALFAVSLAVWALSEVGQDLRRRPEATKREYRSRVVITVCLIAAYGLAALARARITGADYPNGVVTFGVGLVVVWVGIGLRWWSFLSLGRYFTIDVMTSEDQPVINSGPYRFLRHPGYAGLLLVLAGIGTVFGNWLSLAAAIVFPLIGLLYRIRVEEAALVDMLGDAYRSFAAGRKRIIPFVW